jgi:hypothetical protein
LITVALAYGADRLPLKAISYLTDLWQGRHDTRTDGPRYFALTSRLAFFLMALRQAQHPACTQILASADCELRQRILSDGLFVGWQIDRGRRSATGDEFSTAIGILAYALTARQREEIPPEIRRSVEQLQTRMEGSVPPNIGLRKFYLAAVTTALDKKQVSRRLRRLVKLNGIRHHSRYQDTLYFWDYWFLGADGETSRRDYFHVPSDAIDILLACGSTAGRFQRLAALELATEDVSDVLTSGLYFAGRELATSNNQAWISLALSKAKTLTDADQKIDRLLRKCLRVRSGNIVRLLPSLNV